MCCLSHSTSSPNPIEQLFMGIVGLVFAPLAPLVCIAAAIVMWISSWVYKYQLMFVFVTRVETGGVSAFIYLTFVIFLSAISDCGTSLSTVCSLE